MKNSKLAKLVLVVLIGVMITCVGIDVFAADNNTYQDLGSVLNSTGNNAAGGNNTVGGNNTAGANNTIGGNNTLNTNALTNNTANNMTNTTLPKTGVANSTSVIVLITICGISAIYAYNKIKNYKNV